MLAVTGTLAKVEKPEIYAANIRIPMFAQLGTFALGLLFTVFFGIQVSK